jgi:hypothetical protein
VFLDPLDYAKQVESIRLSLFEDYYLLCFAAGCGNLELLGVDRSWSRLDSDLRKAAPSRGSLRFEYTVLARWDIVRTTDLHSFVFRCASQCVRAQRFRILHLRVAKLSLRDEPVSHLI